MKKIMIGIFVLAFSFATISAIEKDEPNDFQKSEYSIIQKWELPGVLEEVSGIDWIGDDKIAAVQDEDGIIFIYDLKASEIIREIEFRGSGDYEGIRISGEDAYILRSDGTIFKVAGYLGDDPVVSEHRTGLSEVKGIDVEGLCLDHENVRFLLAEKERKGNKNSKGIYATHLNLKKSWDQPALKIDLEDPVLKQVKGKAKDRFFPSEIERHPKNKNYYVLDGRNPKLLIMEPGGELEKLYLLDRKEFAQPEGLTFDEEGNMYISNEAGKGPANILKVSLE